MAKRNDFVFPNISQKVKVLPKFKPITDEQIMRVNEILRDLPIRNGRRGRMINYDTQSKHPNSDKFNGIKSNLKSNVNFATINDNLAADIDNDDIDESNMNLPTSDVNSANFAAIDSDLVASDSNSASFGVKANTVLKGNMLKFKPELKRRDGYCPQGGTCEFFFYCWMVGGLLDGTCGGLLKGCCHRVAKAGVLGVHDSNSIEYSPNEAPSYGPVINDESKFSSIFRIIDSYTITLLFNFYFF